MMQKLTSRSRVRNSQWLADVALLDWNQVQPPIAAGLRVQRVDLLRNLDGDALTRQIREKFQDVSERVADPNDRPATDGEMGAFIHKAMDGITAREASDPDLWAHMTVLGCPEYVRWRWSKGDADLKRRYVGAIQRNAFARLWWWAEITHDPETVLEDPARYAETLHVRGRQDFIMYSLDCTFSGHRLLVRKLCELQRARQISPRDQQKLGRAVNRIARVVCLDVIGDAAEAQHLSDRAFELIALLRA